jgi:hypothetical protein
MNPFDLYTIDGFMKQHQDTLRIFGANLGQFLKAKGIGDDPLLRSKAAELNHEVTNACVHIQQGRECIQVILERVITLNLSEIFPGLDKIDEERKHETN